MPIYESQSDRASHRLKDFLVPSPAAAVLYVLLSMILLIVINTGTIISRFDNNYLKAAQNLKANFTELGNGFSSSFSTALGGRLGQMLLWSFIGAAAYILIWLVKNILNSFENDIIADHYLHPATYNRAGYWGSSMAGKIFLFATIMVVASYIFITITVTLPAIAGLASSAAYNFKLQTSPLYLLLCVGMGTVLIYVGVLLLRIVSRLWKLL